MATVDQPHPAAPDGVQDLAQFALDLSLRQLDYQTGTFDELRSRTGVLLAAAALAASFLGPQALERHGYSVFTTIGLIAFTVALVLCVAVLFPRTGLQLSPPADKNFEALWPLRERPAEWRRTFAYWVQKWAKENRAKIRRLQFLYVCAAAALLIEVLGFTLRIAIR